MNQVAKTTSPEKHIPKKIEKKKNCSRVVPVLFAQTERFPRNSSDCWNFYRIATEKTAGSKSNIRAENAEMGKKREERKDGIAFKHHRNT
jgi:hypothetical protein